VTTAPATTTVPTPPPPSGVQFFEDFSTDTRARFDWRGQTSSSPGLTPEFLGEHNMDCAGPDTTRVVHAPAPLLGLPWGGTSNVDVTNTELVWWCAPGGNPANGHMMTALNDGGIGTLSFTPKQTLTNIHSVCWDQNMNNLGGGKWLNVFVVPAGAYSGDPAYAATSGLPFGGIPQMPPDGTVDFTWFTGSIEANVWSGGHSNHLFDAWKSSPDYPGFIGMDPSPAPRYTICLDDAADTVTLERPFDGLDSDNDVYAVPGLDFPDGNVKVIFQDASYNPDKHEGTGHLTWHWDNITIS
jgi:hypothetical protein